YAAEINAGSTYLDNTQLYVNPVNCCVYVPERMSEEHVLELKLPVNYKVCGSLKKSSEFTLHATNFEELADSPFIASASVKTISFFANDLPVHLHFMGECLPDEKKLVEDFKKFTEHSLDFFGDAPISEYHFLFQILPYRFYHGVEHLKSTVIALGPGYNLMQGSTYEDLLGVSCHELFHLWNIKTIRPVEMQPYDYTKENYAHTGYVYEGFTTYYGDLLLYQCGVFNQEQYFKTLEERLDKHFHNYGRFNLSLANSSFDNWLDGYVPGV
ncbi:MAG: M61 family peptidase, partial [Bacteroidota bacterium]